MLLEAFFTLLTASITASECPWAVSMTSKSTPASIKQSDLRYPSSPTVVAAATLNLPRLSLQAVGFKTACSVSFKVSKPVSRPFTSVISNFSIRLSFIRLIACRRSAGSVNIAKFSFVIIFDTGVLLSAANRISRLVTIPTTRSFSSTTGKPVTLYRSLRILASAKV